MLVQLLSMGRRVVLSWFGDGSCKRPPRLCLKSTETWCGLGCSESCPCPPPACPAGCCHREGGGGWAVARVLGATGKKIGAGPGCQQAPALDPTVCMSVGVWSIPLLCRAHCPHAAPLPGLEGAWYRHRSPLAISKAGSGLPPSEPPFPQVELDFTAVSAQPCPNQYRLWWAPRAVGQLQNPRAALWGCKLGEGKPGPPCQPGQGHV